jgi:hypothetical protein
VVARFEIFRTFGSSTLANRASSLFGELSLDHSSIVDVSNRNWDSKFERWGFSFISGIFRVPLIDTGEIFDRFEVILAISFVSLSLIIVAEGLKSFFEQFELLCLLVLILESLNFFQLFLIGEFDFFWRGLYFQS